MSSDSVQLCLSRKTGEMLQRLRANRPLVHCITNEVVQEITADVLLAAGASPAAKPNISPALPLHFRSTSEHRTKHVSKP